MVKKRASSDDEVNLSLLSYGNGSGQEQVDHHQDSHAVGRTVHRRSSSTPLFKRRRLWTKIACFGVALTVIGSIFWIVNGNSVKNVRWPKWNSEATVTGEDTSMYRDKSRYVTAGAPGVRFRNSLRNDTKYVTASPMGGFSNEVMAQTNLIYLARLVGRVPVLSDFVPGHMHGNPGFLPVSTVFDLPRLAETLRMPILEWSDLKLIEDPKQGEWEDIGCWSLHVEIFGKDANSGGHFQSEHQNKLEISLTPVPNSRFTPGTNHLNIVAVASLDWPIDRAEALKHAETVPSRSSKHTLPPDQHMLCYDALYYAATVKPYEWFEPWVPMWTQVGRFMHWEPKIEAMARNYVYHAFKLNSETDPFPEYVSIHIRHTDFAYYCQGKTAVECFPPLSTYGEKVEEVKAELLEKRGLRVDKVLVTSDEEDEAWWKTVEEYGWHRINWVEEKTEEMYNEWYPIVLDSIALSLGKGFVGTARSTLSMLAARRVEDWENGFSREVSLRFD